MIEPTREEWEAKNVESDHEGMDSNKDLRLITHQSATLTHMKVRKTLKHQLVTIWIDTSSTNNFMDSKVADRLTYHVESYDKFEVKFTNGCILTYDSKCSKIKLIIQGQELLIDFFLLPLQDFEMVPGIE